MTKGLYAYGVVRQGDVSLPTALGVDDDDSLRFVESGALAAVVSDVEIDQFEGDRLAENAAAGDWLERKVRAHERVLDELVVQGAVVPMRFGSIFSRPELLLEMLESASEDLLAALDRVRGKCEWGVKAYLLDRTPEKDPVPAPVSTGRDYLMRKRAALDSATRAAEAARDTAGRVLGALSEVAEETALMPLRNASTAVILNAAFLVAERRRDRFMRLVQDLQEGGSLVLDVTGPWPPYNFTSVDVSGAVS
ncbi:MAG: GvpL/GvpF family gas vesicle protein [Actinomycetota bacterium]|nr:GvpL/GvpF family gas vesicle protein [Actinomycetota bacterium]